MADIDSIKYSKHYLSNVICRIDFSTLLSESILSELSMEKDIINYFPLKLKDIVEEETNFNLIDEPGSEPVLSKEKNSFIRKTFVDSEGANKFIFSPKYILLDYSNYSSFEMLRTHLETIVKKIILLSPEIVVTRFGLRYINTFNVDDMRIQKSFFSNILNEFVCVSSLENATLSRAMGHFEYVNNDIRLNFNFGEFNRNYPGILQKRDFVLDYDASVQMNYKLSDILSAKLNIAHTMIQEAFENSITDKLRDMMK